MAREKEKKEKELRELAQKARMEHGGMPLNERVDGTNSVCCCPMSENVSVCPSVWFLRCGSYQA